MEQRTCAKCGSHIADDAPEGLCPRCVLAAGLESDAKESGAGALNNVEPSMTPEAIMQDLPNLEILEVIGQGGMGVVYKARQRNLDRMVALKVLLPRWRDNPAFEERFMREARAMAKLSHPAIVSVYDFGRAGQRYYLVLEYVDGINLREALQQGKFTSSEVLRIVPLLCDALEYAHREGVVHRDIKPENILIDQRGRVKVTDFGLAKLLSAGRSPLEITSVRDVLGTPHYMAPEQVEGRNDVDHRADIYALGVVFYEMLTGQLPLGRFAPPSRKVLVDVRLDEVVLRALAQDPELRYQSAEAVRTDVESIVRSGQSRSDDRPRQQTRLDKPSSPASLPRQPTPHSSVQREETRREIPGILWIAIISLALMILGKLLAVQKAGPRVLIDVVLSGILLYGIIRGYKWGYLLTVGAVVIMAFLSTVTRGVEFGLLVLAIDCLVLVPVLLCKDYFFPKRTAVAEHGE